MLVAASLMSLVPSLPANAHGGETVNSAWTDEPPTIDGTKGEAEWKGDVLNIATKTHLRNYDASISVTAMNDEKYFYLNMQVFPPRDITPIASHYHLLGIYFDSNHDGVLNEKGDLVATVTYGHGHGDGTVNHYLKPYSGGGIQKHAFSVGWTGEGWIYESKIPFTLDNGYTWAKPGDKLGFATDWITFREHDSVGVWSYLGEDYRGMEEIIVPPDSVYHYAQADLRNPGEKTAVPARFMDIVLAGSRSDKQSSITKTGDSEVPIPEETAQMVTVVQSDASLGPYLAAGIAVAGGAVAAAIVLTRRKPSKQPGQ